MKLLHVVVITSPGIDVPVLEEALAAAGLTPSSHTSRETGLGTIYLIADGPENAEALRQAAEDALNGWDELLQGKPAISCQTMQQEDWSESWKKHFHTFRASERLVVKPSWEAYEAPGGDVILSLDPVCVSALGITARPRHACSSLTSWRAQAGASVFSGCRLRFRHFCRSGRGC